MVPGRQREEPRVAVRLATRCRVHRRRAGGRGLASKAVARSLLGFAGEVARGLGGPQRGRGAGPTRGRGRRWRQRGANVGGLFVNIVEWRLVSVIFGGRWGRRRRRGTCNGRWGVRLLVYGRKLDLARLGEAEERAIRACCWAGRGESASVTLGILGELLLLLLVEVSARG